MWIGSLAGLVILSIRADQARDNAEFGRVIEYVLYFAPRVFTPASLLVLALGIIMSFMVWGFHSLWIVLGLVGFAATFVTGFFVLRPDTPKPKPKPEPAGDTVASGQETNR